VDSGDRRFIRVRCPGKRTSGPRTRSGISSNWWRAAAAIPGFAVRGAGAAVRSVAARLYSARYVSVSSAYNNIGRAHLRFTWANEATQVAFCSVCSNGRDVFYPFVSRYGNRERYGTTERQAGG